MKNAKRKSPLLEWTLCTSMRNPRKSLHHDSYWDGQPLVIMSLNLDCYRVICISDTMVGLRGTPPQIHNTFKVVVPEMIESAVLRPNVIKIGVDQDLVRECHHAFFSVRSKYELVLNQASRRSNGLVLEGSSHIAELINYPK
jgi:hypothetical protein